MTPDRPLVVETIASERALLALEPEWLALERSSGNTLPFRTFAWALSWWRHLREDRLQVRDTLAYRAVRAPDGRLVCVAPFIVTERPGAGPIRARCCQLIGADPNVTELRSALAEPSEERAAYAAIREDLERSFGDLDWIRWTGIDERHGACDALGRSGVCWRDGVSCYVVDLPSTWEELRASRPPNLKEALRKCYKSLARENRSFTFEVVENGPKLAPALTDFFHLHAARAKVVDTVRHNDVFAHESCRAFLRDVAQRFADRGELRVFRLHVDGALVASRVGFVLGGSLYLYFSGFDPEYSKYGVATTLVAEAMKYAIGEKLSSVNLSTGKDTSKLRWRPREIPFREALIVSPSVLGRAKYEAFHAAERAMVESPVGRYAQRLLSRRASPRAAAVG